MNYTVEQIFKKCPEISVIKNKKYETFEWTIKESETFSGILLNLFSFLTLFELETSYDWLFSNKEKADDFIQKHLGS